MRVLVDDPCTGGADTIGLGFAAHPGVHVRLFKPFTTARSSGPLGRFATALWNWPRIKHCMHNKLFIVDGAWAIFGGRNVADSY